MKPIRTIKRDNLFEADLNNLRVEIIDQMNDNKLQQTTDTFKVFQ